MKRLQNSTFGMTLILSALCFLLLWSALSLAEPVDEQTARIVAANWMTQRTGVASLPQTDTQAAFADEAYYAFNTGPHGFAIVSADDVAHPVIFYSKTGRYTGENHPPQFDEMMAAVREEILNAIQMGLKPDKKTADAWTRLATPSQSVPHNPVLDAVAPLLQTTWNQGQYYNEQCPADASGPGGHAWAGCVATAVAQIMRYHARPFQGTGSRTYTHSDYGSLSANFGATTYDWASMPNSMGSSNAEVAQLLFHVGVALRMDYGPSESGAYSSDVPDALTDYFRYATNASCLQRGGYTGDWLSLMRGQINASQPMYYSGGGHAFVLDGYEGTEYFHINWGWGGLYDGYFYLDDLTPGSYSFKVNQTAVVNISPADAPGVVDSFEWDSIAGTQTVSSPFSVTITAKDNVDGTADSFTDTVELTALRTGRGETIIGTIDDVNELPWYLAFYDVRLQTIYLQSEIGAAGLITSLSLDVGMPPAATLNNWTIRMKHTALSSYSTASFEGAGWTTVYQNDETISSTSWEEFAFDSNFEYNGIDNLMIDFSFSNSAEALYGLVIVSSIPDRSVYGLSWGTNGDPLTWSGTSNPSAFIDDYVPRIKLGGSDTANTVLPATTGNFTAGVWTGDITIENEGTDIHIEASDGTGRTGNSNTFDVGDDDTPPTIQSCLRADPSPTALASMDFTITFSETVIGVGDSDFTLTTTGDVSGASVTSVSGSGTSRTVTVNAGGGNGTIRLDVDGTITDLALNALAGTYTSGEAYTIDRASVYVDPDSALEETGSPSHPFDTLAEALTLVDSGGTVYLEGGTTTTAPSPSISQSVILNRSGSGTARVEAAP
jgi:Peptidase C10 family/Spi protease inhibitor